MERRDFIKCLPIAVLASSYYPNLYAQKPIITIDYDMSKKVIATKKDPAIDEVVGILEKEMQTYYKKKASKDELRKQISNFADKAVKISKGFKVQIYKNWGKKKSLDRTIQEYFLENGYHYAPQHTSVELFSVQYHFPISIKSRDFGDKKTTVYSCEPVIDNPHSVNKKEMPNFSSAGGNYDGDILIFESSFSKTLNEIYDRLVEEKKHENPFREMFLRDIELVPKKEYLKTNKPNYMYDVLLHEGMHVVHYNYLQDKFGKRHFRSKSNEFAQLSEIVATSATMVEGRMPNLAAQDIIEQKRGDYSTRHKLFLQEFVHFCMKNNIFSKSMVKKIKSGKGMIQEAVPEVYRMKTYHLRMLGAKMYNRILPHAKVLRP